MSFLKELVKKGLINESQIEEINNLAQEKYKGDVEEVLKEMGISDEDILVIKGEYFNIPIKKVNTKETSFKVLKYIPEDAARHYHFVPFGLKDGVLEIGITDPEDIQRTDVLQFISTKLDVPFKLFLITKSDYEEVMDSYGGISIEVGEELDRLDEEQNITDVGMNLKDELNKEKIKKK